MALAFTKSTTGENEIWMLLVEKAYAKVCGSYEAMELDIAGPNEGEVCQTKDFVETGDEEKDKKLMNQVGSKIGVNADRVSARTEEVFGILNALPTVSFKIDDYKKDINRAGEKEERLDKLWRIIDECNQKGWIMTANSAAIPPKLAMNMDTKTLHWATIDGKGIKFSHAYTVLYARPLVLANGFTDIILLLRNPWGKDTRGDQWLGDWGPSDDLWTKHTKKQISQELRLLSD